MNQKKISLLIGSVLGLLLLGVWLTFFNYRLFIKEICNLNFSFVLLGVFFYIIAYYIRSIRWNILLQKYGRVSILQTWVYAMAGNFINYLIPIRLGEVVKCWILKKRNNLKLANTLPSVFIDKSFDTIGIFFVLILIPILSFNLSQGSFYLLSAMLIIFFISVGILIMAAFHEEKVIALIAKFFFWLPRKFQERIEYYLNLFIGELNILEHHWTNLLWCLLLTALGIVFDGLYFFSMFKAFNYEISFLIVLLGYTLINLSYALPQPPAQIGSNEWMMLIIFTIGLNVNKSVASNVMAFAHILTAFIIALTGILAMSITGTKFTYIIEKGDRLNG